MFPEWVEGFFWLEAQPPTSSNELRKENEKKRIAYIVTTPSWLLMLVYMYVYEYMCVFIYIHIYVYIYTYICNCKKVLSAVYGYVSVSIWSVFLQL